MSKRLQLILEFVKDKYGDLSSDEKQALLICILSDQHRVREEVITELQDFEKAKLEQAKARKV